MSRYLFAGLLVLVSLGCPTPQPDPLPVLPAHPPGTGQTVQPAPCAPPAHAGPPAPLALRFDIASLVPAELLRQANRGREVLREDGRFAFPAGVRRVWIDVGAHHLQTTRAEFLAHSDLGLVAIEPLSECWDKWPESDRLIGLPVALFSKRGHHDFHVNKLEQTSALGKVVEGAGLEQVMPVVEVRSVPVLLLADVLERIPRELPVTYLKTDVQNVDLQVLKSGGDDLRRVFRVRAEVMNSKFYEDVDGERGGTEQEFIDYLAAKGFRFVRDLDVFKDRAWLDKEFVNTEHERYLR